MTIRPNNTCLFHVSDVHFGVEDRAALAWFAQAVAEERPDAVICTGDITQRAKYSEYAAAQDWFTQLAAPVLIQPGNHDMPYYNLWERFRRPYARFEALHSAVENAWDSPHAVVVRMDTNAAAQRRWPWSDGIVKQPYLDAALARLQALPDDGRLRLVACHHPLLSAGDEEEDNPTIGGDAAFAALAQAGADAILSGHVHFPFDMVRQRGGRDLRMIGAGTLSTRLRGAGQSYNVLTIDAGGAVKVETRGFTRA